MMRIQATLFAAGAVLALAGGAQAATLVASYNFNNSLNSTSGGPALTAVDPSGGATFVTDTVNGNSQTVYQTAGVNSPPSSQGGLTFADPSLVNNATGYSVEMTFEFVPGQADRDDAWRRILDSQDRTSDDGFYADPSNQLDVYPVAGSTAGFVAGAYRNVVLTVDTATDVVDGYIDQGSDLTASTNVMNFINANDVLGFFLDNTQGGGQGEWAPVRIATINVFAGVLTPQQAEAFDGQSFGVPEPASWALMLVGFGGLGAMLRRRSRVAVAA